MTLYLDTSSLVKLYVAEPDTEAVRRLVDDAAIVATSQIAYPETRAALARRRREGALSPRAFATARRTFEADWARYFAVEVTASLCSRGGRAGGTASTAGVRQRSPGVVRRDRPPRRGGRHGFFELRPEAGSREPHRAARAALTG